MTVDEALDEWAVGQHRQPFRSCVVQRGFDEQRSQALAIVRRVDLGVDEGDDAGSATVLGKPTTDPSTAISKRLRSETSVMVGAIASDWAPNAELARSFVMASGGVGGSDARGRSPRRPHRRMPRRA